MSSVGKKLAHKQTFYQGQLLLGSSAIKSSEINALNDSVDEYAGPYLNEVHKCIQKFGQ